MASKKIENFPLKEGSYREERKNYGSYYQTILTPAEGECEGTLVFFHGTGNHKLYPLINLLPILMKLNLRFILSDLPGHGEHSFLGFSPKNCDSYCQSISNLVGDLYSLDKLFILGHSLGAVVAISNFQKFNQYKAHLVTIGMPQLVAPTWKAAISEASSILRPDVWYMLLSKGTGIIPALGPLRSHTFTIHGKNFRKHFRNCIDYINQQDMDSHLQKIDEPHLMVFGGLDYIALSPLSSRTNISDNHIIYICRLENHFTLLLSKDCCKNVERFISLNLRT